MATLRGLPLGDPEEIEHATGFLKVVRALVTVPLTSVGVLGTLAAFASGHGIVGAIAGTTTVLIVYSLIRDTRLSKALERLRAGQVAEAEAGMMTLVAATDQPDPQRQRAQGYLASIAWLRGDHREALRWTRARRASLEHGRSPADERFVTEASEALLLALTGELEAAQAVLGALDSTPEGLRYARAAAVASLAVAFALDDVSRVRAELVTWEALTDEQTPLLRGWLAWAFAGCDDRRRAQHWVASVRAERESLAVQCPALAEWCRTFESGAIRYRRG